MVVAGDERLLIVMMVGGHKWLVMGVMVGMVLVVVGKLGLPGNDAVILMPEGNGDPDV